MPETTGQLEALRHEARGLWSMNLEQAENLARMRETGERLRELADA